MISALHESVDVDFTPLPNNNLSTCITVIPLLSVMDLFIRHVMFTRVIFQLQGVVTASCV
jgi:hypothetical protein